MNHETLLHLKTEALHLIERAEDEKSLEEYRLSFLGKKGSISLMMRELGQMSPEDRQVFGPLLNGLKDDVTMALTQRRDVLENQALEQRLAAEWVDVTLPPAPATPRTLHPISQVMEELVSIFGDMGFVLEEGPDIETEDYNFNRLNIPDNHPARQMHDTFYFPAQEEGNRPLLRTHTSPVQVRTLLTQTPPVRMITFGRTYRCDSDMTHTPMFHQIEGLVIDKSTHMGHLKGTVETFCRRFFGVDDLNVRLRPSHFPFTEPSVEMDIGCDRQGKQLKIGEGNDWLEVLGAGMVHPHVLKACGIDPDVYQGFAFGMGIDRLAMLKYGISDLRSFFDSDARWLSHYGFSPLSFPQFVRGETA